MNAVAVLNVVGLTPELLGEHTPRLSAWAARGSRCRIEPMLPAVTCSVQSTYLTGVPPAEHGIVANGWYFRDLDEIKFWRQSNRLVEGPKIWDTLRARDPSFTCANLFWWHAMNSTVDCFVTPRPVYRADGVKLPDILTRPAGLREDLQAALGPFPLFEFWGPNTSIRSSAWIAEAAKRVVQERNPTLTLVYLPHLDYALQRSGPKHASIPGELGQIDAVCGDLIDFLEAQGRQVLVLSEYGIEEVDRPVALNRVLREAGWITVREECGGEILLPGESRAFAVADHQIAHVYVRDPADLSAVRAAVESVPGVERVLDAEGIRAAGLGHPRGGELLALAAPGAWFTYYYWLDDNKAPDFARTVDIHNKPGYDPAELLMDPGIRFPKLRVARRLLQKKLGFRYTMDLIPLSGEGVRGSHGRLLENPDQHPVLLSGRKNAFDVDSMPATDLHELILREILNVAER